MPCYPLDKKIKALNIQVFATSRYAGSGSGTHFATQQIPPYWAGRAAGGIAHSQTGKGAFSYGTHTG
jgi:hypothetical protein